MYDQCCCCLITKSCPTLCQPCKIPQSIGFSRKDYWSGFPVPPPVDLPTSGIKLGSPLCHALAQLDSLTLSHLESSYIINNLHYINISNSKNHKYVIFFLFY